MGALAWLRANPGPFLQALEEHLLLSLTGLAIGIGIGLPLGLLVARRAGMAEAAIALAGLLRTLPSLAILAALLPLLGVGFTPSVVALAVVALPPVLVNTVIGLRGADAEALDRVDHLLDNEVMQELNRQVDQDGDEPREVAARFLQEHGIAR
jgi:osmoprotectant transport system permease protein